MSFATQIGGFAQKAEKSVDNTVRAITFELFRSVIQMSPVGEPVKWQSPPPPGYVGGRFRGNWQTSTGSPETSQIPRIDPSGSSAIAEVFAKAGGLGTVTYLANNLPYAERLEYDGWSQQAPNGMVRVSFARIDSIVAKAAGANKI